MTNGRSRCRMPVLPFRPTLLGDGATGDREQNYYDANGIFHRSLGPDNGWLMDSYFGPGTDARRSAQNCFSTSKAFLSLSLMRETRPTPAFTTTTLRSRPA